MERGINVQHAASWQFFLLDNPRGQSITDLSFKGSRCHDEFTERIGDIFQQGNVNPHGSGSVLLSYMMNSD